MNVAASLPPDSEAGTRASRPAFPVQAEPGDSAHAGRWVSLAVAAAYLAGSLLFTDYRRVFEFNPDEGNNLGKALLLAQGQSFTGGIWSDQPPLFAYALCALFELFGLDVGVARTLVLVSSAVLVFALYDSVRMLARQRACASGAHLGAALAVACLLLSARFGPLRVSVMIGLPSIAMLSLALWAALIAGFGPAEARGRAWLQGMAGAALGVSLGIKLFTLFVAPVVYLTQLAPELAQLRRSGPRALLRASAPFALGLLPVLLVAFAPVLSWSAFSELFRSHVAAARTYTGGTLRNLFAIDAALYVAMLAGLPRVLRAQPRAALPWLVWLALSVVALAVHNPVWLHHSMLMLVPTAGLLGLGVANLVSLAAPSRRPLLALALAATSVGLIATTAGPRVERLFRQAPRHESRRDLRALAAVRDAGVAPGSMITARQIYAFYLNRPMPVLLSVTSLKRLRTGGLETERLVALVDAADTQLVLLSDRWPAELRERVRGAMRGRFQLLYEDRELGELEIWRKR